MPGFSGFGSSGTRPGGLASGNAAENSHSWNTVECKSSCSLSGCVTTGNRGRPPATESMIYPRTWVGALLPPAASSSTAPARRVGRRRDAFCAQIDNDDAVRLEAVREHGRRHSAARGFPFALLDHLHRALVGQRRKRTVAERERVGHRFDQVSLARLLFVALGSTRVRHALDDGAVEELVIGLV